jgi:hypothetical protein
MEKNNRKKYFSNMVSHSPLQILIFFLKLIGEQLAPEPGGKFNVDPCGSGTLSHTQMNQLRIQFSAQIPVPLQVWLHYLKKK